MGGFEGSGGLAWGRGVREKGGGGLSKTKEVQKGHMEIYCFVN